MKLILLVIAVFACSDLWAGIRSKITEANRMYSKQKYEEALSLYRDALIDDPQSAVLRYNLGSALYEMGSYEEALKEFEKATYANDIKLQAKSYYNMGNTLYRMDKLPESIQLYKKALELDPDDEDAKYNIEFVQRKMKENLDKNKQTAGQQEEQQQGSQDEQDQGQDEQQDKKQDDQQAQRHEQKESQAGEKEEEKQKQKEAEEKEQREEEARQLLEKFEDQEKKAQEHMKRRPSPQGAVGGKDW